MYRLFLRHLLFISIIIFAVTTSASAAPSKTVVVLFDVSGSVQKPKIKKQFLADFQIILDAMRPKDVIAADKIATNSIAGSSLPINHEFPGIFSSNRFKTKKMKKEILQSASDILDNPGKVLYTDILGSLHIAERIFDTYKKDRNVLVIMSDMIEDTPRYNFEKEKLSTKRIENIISKEKKAGLLPDLDGVKIYAIKNATKQSRNRYIGIENFWLRYFKECGANLGKANYGPMTKFE